MLAELFLLSQWSECNEKGRATRRLNLQSVAGESRPALTYNVIGLSRDSLTRPGCVYPCVKDTSLAIPTRERLDLYSSWMSMPILPRRSSN